MARRRNTIVDVAEAAGVSIKTVSRVINREPHVRPAVAAKVREAIDLLGFVPNAAARSLAGTRSFMIGIFYDNPSPFYLASLQAGAMEACREADYHLIVEHLPLGNDVDFAAFERTLRTARLDGVILSPPATDHLRLLELLESHGIAIVRLSPLCDPERSPSISSDDEAGAGEIARHLCELGHRRLGFVAGPENHVASVKRRSGFFQELERWAINSSAVEVVAGDFSFKSGMAAGIELLGRQRVTAIFASNDDMAAGVLAAATRLGISVPEEVSVVGFDDGPIATMVWPQLTTVRQPVAEMSAAAARLLIDRPAADLQPLLQRRVELIIRGSTAPSTDIVRASPPGR